MEAERVKTKKVSAADRIPEKTGRKKWSVLFLESLLKEAKEREAVSYTHLTLPTSYGV